MNGYEFMAQHPFLTAFIVWVACAYFAECIKYLSGYKEQNGEQKNQDKGTTTRTGTVGTGTGQTKSRATCRHPECNKPDLL
ncbi:hypothetical protein ACJBPN_04515 [Streptococcus suis]